MKILIAGDIHGKLDQLCRVVEILKPDAVFQTGDLGFFVNIKSMDGPGRRHIEKNPAEGEIFSYLRKESVFPCPLYFIRGNHEDFDLLEEFEKLELRNMYYLRTGVHNIDQLTVGVIGGIYYWGSSHKKRNSPKFTKEEELKFIFREKRADICLAHDAPEGKGLIGGIGGSPYVSLAIESLRPQFLFHGHYGNPPDPYNIGDTHIYPMTMFYPRANEKGLFIMGGTLLGLLTVEAEEMKFHYLTRAEMKQKPLDYQKEY